MFHTGHDILTLKVRCITKASSHVTYMNHAKDKLTYHVAWNIVIAFTTNTLHSSEEFDNY